MSDNDRTKKLRVFLRVGIFAIAMALSAVAVIRILALTRQIQFTQQQLDAAQSAGEDLSQKNEQLLALVSLQDQHHAAAIRNDAYVTRFYELCREPNDLPQLKTDFIVRNHKSNVHGPRQFAFSVPEGGHTLKVAIQKNVMGGSGGPTTNLTFPLLPSSGYIIRIQPDAEEAENEVAQLSLELTSNNADFKPIRQPLPCSMTQLDAALRDTQSDIRARLAESDRNKFDALRRESLLELRAQSNDSYDQQITVYFYLRMMPMYETRGDFENISFPNSVVDLNQVFGLLEHGVELANCHAGSSQTVFTLRLSVVSDAPECVSPETAGALGVARGRLQPYTGNGRFYIRPKN